jgi:large subunit ribosomal protein L24
VAGKLKIKKGDLVQMITGKDRGKQGRVLEAHPSDGRVIVENLNLVKRHTRPRPIRQRSSMGGAQVEPGGIIEKPGAVAISNVMVVCPTCGRPTRVGVKDKETPQGMIRVRVCRRADCREEID